MKQLWAPWRMDYITNNCGGSCIFCIKALADEDRERLVLWRGERAFVMMNRYPYSNGHLMVVPFLHTSDPAELCAETVVEIHHLLVRSKAVLGEVLSPDGFNLGLNLGKVAGAGVADHLHWHLVPRWHGDTNFMPAIADVRVIPEHLEETYDRLHEAFLGTEAEKS